VNLQVIQPGGGSAGDGVHERRGRRDGGLPEADRHPDLDAPGDVYERAIDRQQVGADPAEQEPEILRGGR